MKELLSLLVLVTVFVVGCDGGYSGNEDEMNTSISKFRTLVTVGDSGTILTSSDGTTWTSRTSGTGNKLLGVTYGNGTFVTVGSNGTILTSSDGTTWTSRTSGTSNTLKGVIYSQ